MFKKRIVYRLLLILIVFGIVFVVPLYFRINVGIDTVFKAHENHLPLQMKSYTGLKSNMKDRFTNDFVVISFYIFFVAFLLSLFFSRKILLPVKNLFKGAEAIRKGRFDITLPVLSDDELGEVTDTFNRMAKSIQDYTEELKKKDLYIRTMMDPMWVVDINNTIIDINPAFTKLFGYDKDEVLGLSAFDLLDEENSVIMKYELENKRDKGLSSTYQLSITAKNGRQIPVLITGTPLIINGELQGKVGVIKDFSEQAALTNRLIESKKQLETIMNSIEEEMLVIDREFRVINANKRALEVYGENIIGQHCFTLGHSHNKPCWMSGEDCALQKVLDYGEVQKAVHEHFDLKGKKHHVEIVACPIRDFNGEISHIVQVIRDVTERKRYEETISRKNRELTTLNEISAILSSSLQSDEIFSEVIAKMIEIFDMDGGGVFLLDSNQRILNCVFHKGVTEDFAKSAGKVRIGEDIPGRVAITGELIMTSDVTKDYRVERSILRNSGIKGYCCIPIRGKERILGVFCLFSLKEHHFTEEEQRILTSVGELAGISLENITLYERMRGLFDQQRTRRLHEQKLLLELASQRPSSFDINQFVGTALKLSKEYFRASASWYAVIKDLSEIVIEVAEGMDLKDEERALPLDAVSIENAVSSSGGYIIVDDVYTNKEFFIPDVIQRSNFRTIVGIPIKVSNRVYGAISLFYRNITLIKDEDIHFLLIVANILSAAIETSELYEKRIIDRGLADTVINSILDGVCTIDTDGYITSANASVVRILGLTTKRIIGKHFTDVIPHDRMNHNHVCPVKSALSGKSGLSEIKFLRPDGAELTLQINTSPLIDVKGKVRGVVQVIRDVTKEKEAERMKSELIRSVSHEFRTPLSAIVGMTEMLMDGDVHGERASEYLHTMHSEGRRLSHMVSDLLDLSRIESGRKIFKPDHVDISKLLHKVNKTFQSRCKERNAVLSLKIGNGIKNIYADRTRLEQVFVNVITNSFTYSNKGVKIDISVRKEGRYILFEIRDNGWGIAKKNLMHIGEKFYRGGYADKTKGTGLGIALCREIVQMHNGTFEIKSRLHKGTTVTIKMPLELEEPCQR